MSEILFAFLSGIFFMLGVFELQQDNIVKSIIHIIVCFVLIFGAVGILK